MISVSAYPTVEWLHARAADRPAVSGRAYDRMHAGTRDRATGTTPRTAHPTALSPRAFIEAVTERLREIVADGVSVHVNEWVSTPEGEQTVDIVVRAGDRSIGILIDRRYEQDTETLDALRLVYGHFDTLYRIGRHVQKGLVSDLLNTIVCDKRNWFTSSGRLEVRRSASSMALRTVGPAGTLRSGGQAVRRMRLSRANEWVKAFERALAPNGSVVQGLRPGASDGEKEGQSEGHSEGHPEGHPKGHPKGHSEQD